MRKPDIECRAQGQPWVVDGSPTKPRYVEVKSRALKGEETVLRLTGGETRNCRRFIPVTKGDRIRFDGDKTWVKLPNKRGEVQIEPGWRSWGHLCLNGKRIRVTLKEIATQDELNAYRMLTEFHYRGNGGACRRVPLIAKVNVWNLPKVVGFVELSSSLLVNAERKRNVLDHPYQDTTHHGVGWERWDWNNAKKYTNTIVRISRCVVYPELRGAGLSPMLAEAAVKFARERWHIGGLRPCFIEIVAEMLRYWPFVEKVGFVKVGETEGNLKRARTAMGYLLRRKENGLGYPKGGGGIMSMHRMHAEQLAEIQQARGISVDEILRLLEQSPDKLDARDWVSLHDILRRKKPTYMRGLTPSANAHLQKCIGASNAGRADSHARARRSESHGEITGMKISATAMPQNSARCRRVQEAFGIVSTEFNSLIVDRLDVKFEPGEIILVNGSSGVGKSAFLRAARHLLTGNAKLPDGVRVEADNAVKAKRVAQLQKPPRNKAPIDLLGRYDIDESMRILAQAGLAEAHLFVRPSFTLSVGQSYRLALALALAKKPEVLLIDEFCEPLDEYTSAVICRKLRKAATNEGVSVVVATADARKVLQELQPDRVLLLLSSGQHEWRDGKTIDLAR